MSEAEIREYINFMFDRMILTVVETAPKMRAEIANCLAASKNAGLTATVATLGINPTQGGFTLSKN